MKALIRTAACLVLLTVPASAVEGLITLPSGFDVKQTIDRLEAGLKSGGATVFARIDHAAGATSVGARLRPTEVLIFGNPKGGTPLMQAQQSTGIDLPMKALAWEDKDGKTWLSYNDPGWIASRHGLSADTAKLTDALAAALKGAATKATTKP